MSKATDRRTNLSGEQERIRRRFAEHDQPPVELVVNSVIVERLQREFEWVVVDEQLAEPENIGCICGIGEPRQTIPVFVDPCPVRSHEEMGDPLRCTPELGPIDAGVAHEKGMVDDGKCCGCKAACGLLQFGRLATVQRFDTSDHERHPRQVGGVPDISGGEQQQQPQHHKALVRFGSRRGIGDALAERPILAARLLSQPDLH